MYAIRSYYDHVIDLAQPFARLTIVEAIRRYHPHFSAADLADRAVLEREVRKAGVEPKRGAVLGELQLVLFEETTEQLLIQRNNFVKQTLYEIIRALSFKARIYGEKIWGWKATSPAIVSINFSTTS